MQITPVIAIHMAAALAAVAIGPIALWARQGATQRPRIHRAAGYAWVTLMVATAVSALFISGGGGPRLPVGVQLPHLPVGLLPHLPVPHLPAGLLRGLVHRQPRQRLHALRARGGGRGGRRDVEPLGVAALDALAAQLEVAVLRLVQHLRGGGEPL